AAAGGTGCAGWVGFMLIGLLSSGRGFHISAPFSFDYLLSSERNQFSCLERLSQISIRSLTASLLLYSNFK
ncbi:MAG TPA: hypothetical protein VLA83_17980, partial [Candidatus Binatia bacterium]|nr:hypothetical protein [Candidatus Binatia bacterium]